MDATDQDSQSTIDANRLTPLVRRALKRSAAEVVDWQANELHGGGLTTKIKRFFGTAQVGNTTHPWSLILKIIRPEDQENDLSSLRYWKREALVYQSGLLDNLPGKIRAPRCYEIVEQPGREVWLWLEEVGDDMKGRWPLEQYGNVARHVGEFNGIFFENASTPSYPWMTRNALRAWVGTEAPIVPPEILAHPLVSRYCPNDIYTWMQRIWSERTTWYDIIERQPKALSHLDVFRRNAFAQRTPEGDMQTVLIDWAFVGGAALGEEIAPLVAGSVNFLECDSSQLHALDQIVFDGYLDGLRSAGWHGDPRAIRFAYAVSSVLKYSVGVYGVAFMVADKSQQPILEQIFGHPAEELVEVWRSTLRFLIKLSDEARELAGQIL